MLKGLKKFFLKMMAGANIVTVIIMLLVGMAGRLSPAEHPMLTNAGLLYPVFLLINLAFMIFWLTFHWKGVLIPIVGYLLCYGSLRVYLPLNMPADAPDDAIKVMTYNVCRFAKGSIRDDGTNPVIEYIKQSGADIVCLQEASSVLISQKDISRELSKVYEYGDTVVRHYSGNTIAIYSKYPIVGKERIEFDSKWNISAAFKVLIDGDTVMVVNNHLETNKLLEDEQQKFKKMMKGDDNRDEVVSTSRLLISRLAEAAVIRQPEALAVAAYIRMHEGMPMIVCGDFNDNPLSYARRVVANGLTDCFVTTGLGLGWTFNKSGMYVRIDNIFCSQHWEPYRCHVDRKNDASDHYPVVCWLKKRLKH